jgi:hypothetical protein
VSDTVAGFHLLVRPRFGNEWNLGLRIDTAEFDRAALDGVEHVSGKTFASDTTESFRADWTGMSAGNLQQLDRLLTVHVCAAQTAETRGADDLASLTASAAVKLGD